MSADRERPDGAPAAPADPADAPRLDDAVPAARAALLDAPVAPQFAGRARPRPALRVNGTRLGDPARPTPPADAATSCATAARLPTRLGLRVHAALSTRPNTYVAPGDDDDGVAS